VTTGVGDQKNVISKHQQHVGTSGVVLMVDIDCPRRTDGAGRLSHGLQTPDRGALRELSATACRVGGRAAQRASIRGRLVAPDYPVVPQANLPAPRRGRAKAVMMRRLAHGSRGTIASIDSGRRCTEAVQARGDKDAPNCSRINRAHGTARSTYGGGGNRQAGPCVRICSFSTAAGSDIVIPELRV